MKPPAGFSRIVNLKRYSVGNATLLASDDISHGLNDKGNGHYLYRTAKNNYFIVTMRPESYDLLEPVTLDQAINLYEFELSRHITPFEAAFPGVEIEEA